MGRLLEVRQRIAAVENIRTIARTLATVAAARLSRTRRRAAGLGAYAGGIRGMLANQQAALAREGVDPGSLPALVLPREPVRNVTLLLVASDRGMCGGYNLEASRVAEEAWRRFRKEGARVAFIAKGRRAASYLRRQKAEVVHQEGWPRAGVVADDVERLLGILLARYRSGLADEIHAAYTRFHSPVHRTPATVRLLPVELPAGGPAPAGAERWSYEPGPRALLDELVATYLRVQLWDVLLESYASEHGARMITMEEATERADRSLEELRVTYNRLRREAITTDLLGALFAARAAGQEAG
jgi:F-type H+-transporting ATPase subunit gamma